jgi:Ger(x)C family germination protein
MLAVSGCWDRREVNDIAIVIAMALDKEANGLYRLSVQVPLVSRMGGATGGGGGGTGGDKSYYVDSAVGKTIRDANNILQSRMSRELYYAHHRIVIIGERLAKEGFSGALDIISRFPENRLTAYIVMTRGTGIDLLNAQPQFERFSGEAIRELVKSVAIPVSIKDAAQMLNTPGVDAFLPIFAPVDTYPKGKSKEIQVVGIATFRKDKLVATYPKKEVLGLRWFQRTFDPFTVTVMLEGKARINVQISTGKADIRPSIQKMGHVHYDIEVMGSAIVFENLTSLDISKDQNIKMIETKVGQVIMSDIQKIMEQMKKTRTDTVGLGILMARYYPRAWQERYRDRWDEELSRISYKIKTKVQVTSIGQTTKNLTKEEP